MLAVYYRYRRAIDRCPLVARWGLVTLGSGSGLRIRMNIHQAHGGRVYNGRQTSIVKRQGVTHDA